MPHPNILLIMTDQQRSDSLGCYGFAAAKLLDFLVNQEVRHRGKRGGEALLPKWS